MTRSRYFSNHPKEQFSYWLKNFCRPSLRNKIKFNFNGLPKDRFNMVGVQNGSHLMFDGMIVLTGVDEYRAQGWYGGPISSLEWMDPFMIRDNVMIMGLTGNSITTLFYAMTTDMTFEEILKSNNYLILGMAILDKRMGSRRLKEFEKALVRKKLTNPDFDLRFIQECLRFRKKHE